MKFSTGEFAAEATLLDEGRGPSDGNVVHEWGEPYGVASWQIAWGPSLGDMTAKVVINLHTAGTTPTILLDGRRAIVFGFDRSVIAVEPISGEIVFENDLESTFRAFHKQSGRLLIVYESGILAFDEGWMPLWQVNTDLIDQVSMEGDVLKVQSFEGDRRSIRLSDGRAIEL